MPRVLKMQVVDLESLVNESQHTAHLFINRLRGHVVIYDVAVWSLELKMTPELQLQLPTRVPNLDLAFSVLRHYPRRW